MTAVLRLAPGHVQPVWAGHPWVYAQAVAQVTGARPGDLVTVVDPKGTFLGRGFYSPGSAIAVRLLTRHEDVAVDGAFFVSRLRAALDLRKRLHLPSDDTNAFRLVHAEGDHLPGLVVDVFDDVCAVQIGTLGLKQREGLVLEALQAVLGPRAIVDRTSADVAKREGFTRTEGSIRGPRVTQLVFRERRFDFELPETVSQKTGFYFDQRPLRARIEQLSHGLRVVDAYSFVGTFALAAARGGAAKVLAIDESAPALEAGAEIARKNGLAGRIEHVRKDARKALAEVAASGGADLVLCDPPKLAATRSSRSGALPAYRALAALGVRATVPDGLLVFCSCSGAVGVDALTRALALGARDAGRDVVVLERHFQGADHPVPAAFPEGLYLKSLVARVVAR